MKIDTIKNLYKIKLKDFLPFKKKVDGQTKEM